MLTRRGKFRKMSERKVHFGLTQGMVIPHTVEEEVNIKVRGIPYKRAYSEEGDGIVNIPLRITRPRVFLKFSLG